ncbi:MAG: MFS transporter [Coriobacteriales bacterium]|jgi:MFS family permease|nr:MFS transporter [Coriobacteriales bacterium]
MNRGKDAPEHQNESHQSYKGRALKVAVGSIVMTAVSVGTYMSIPVYLLPISELTGSSVGQVTLFFSVAAIVSLLSSLFFGTLLKTLGIKVLATIAGVALAAFFIILSFTDNIIVVYIASIPYGFATVGGGYAASQTCITWWYPKGTAKIISFITVGVGIVAFILSPLLASSIAGLGIGITAFAEGVGGGIIMILCALFLLAERPEVYGFATGSSDQAAPEGQIVEETASQSATKGPSNSGNSGNVLRVPQFWIIFLAGLLATTAMTGFANNASPFYQTIGCDPVQAAMGISVFNIAALAWAPLFGALVDKKGPGVGTLVCGGIGVVALLAATLITGFMGAMIVAAMVSSLNLAVMLGSVTYPRVFGTKEAGTLIGFANAAGSVGGIIGPPLAGFMFDAMDSYSPFMFVAGALMVICILLIIIGSRRTLISD